MKKTYIEEGTFSTIPKDIYIKYDEMRKELVDEVFIRIKDALSYDSIDQMLKLLRPEDENLLRLIHQKGAIRSAPELKDVITRCRSRSLIISTHRVGNNVMYDLSQLGKDVLLAIDADDRAKEKIRRKGDDD
jgi:predicted transcriptional regulator